MIRTCAPYFQIFRRIHIPEYWVVTNLWTNSEGNPASLGILFHDRNSHWRLLKNNCLTLLALRFLAILPTFATQLLLRWYNRIFDVSKFPSAKWKLALLSSPLLEEHLFRISLNILSDTYFGMSDVFNYCRISLFFMVYE